MKVTADYGGWQKVVEILDGDFYRGYFHMDVTAAFTPRVFNAGGAIAENLAFTSATFYRDANTGGGYPLFKAEV